MSHAQLSPSSASRWLACHGSVALSAKYPDTSSEFADDGTASHTLAGWVLASDPREGRTASYYRETPIEVRNEDGSLRRTFEVDEDRASYVQVYVDAIRDRITGDAQLLIEQRLDTGLVSSRYGRITGTGDAVILRPFERTIEVHDLKYGRGVRVTAKDNPQLLLYALGAMHDYAWLMPVEKIKVAIHQPRLDHYDEFEYTVEELRIFAAAVRETIKAMDAGDETLTPGESQCRFCPAAAECPALRENALKAAQEDFADLTEFGIGKAMDQVELVERWCEAVRAEARRLLDAGTKVPGWMLEEGRQGNRKWADEKAARGAMIVAEVNPDKPPVTLSPADAEKKLAKKNPTLWGLLQKYITRGAPSVSMVRDDGTRKPYERASLDEFKEQA